RIRLEPWRQDADECVGCAAQGYRLAQYRRITPEPPLPQTITHEENLRPARPVLHLGERAPEDWLRPEQPEITARDVDPLHKLRPVSTTQIEAAGDEIVSRQVLEERIVLLPIGEHRYGVRTAASSSDVHNATRFWVWQRMQQHGINHRKERCVRADAQGERGQHGQGEAWTFDQNTAALPQVLNKS